MTVHPHDTDADELATYDGVLLSPGPGDPEPLQAETDTVRELLGRTHVLGICLGHQLIARATGHATYKLPFGHRGANHPVHERLTGRVLVTSQNHGFAVEPNEAAGVSHVSLYDGTVEGLDLPELRARSLQFHPEAGPLARTTRGRCSRPGSTRSRMPRCNDIESICIVGSGPIVIGQAAEFDYAGCQALKVLREDGFRTIVVNSNPATIMTDPGFADRTYLEPLDVESVAEVLRLERPDALLPTMGGQTALNLARELANEGVLDELGIELIGARLDAIERAEDRLKFKEAVESCNLKVPTSAIVTSLDELEGLEVPAVVRPAFTLGGHGGGFAYSADELYRQVERGLSESPIGQVLVEESVRGWDEFELEVVRDRIDNVVSSFARSRTSTRWASTRAICHRRAADDAPRRGVPGAARCGRRRDPRGRRRHRRLEHPVRPQS